MLKEFFNFLENLKGFGLELFGLYYGIYPGIVVDNEDEEGLGRITVKVPTIYRTPGKEESEPLCVRAFPVFPLGGKGYGSFIVPEKGDPVWVMFEHGRLEKPVYIGGWIAEKIPDLDKVTKRGIYTKSGNKLIIDDEKGVITIQDKGGNKIITESESGKITIESKSGDTIVITGDGKIVVKSSSQVLLGSDGATEPVILGNQWLNLFTTHTHPTGVGPSGPPTNAGQAQGCLSQKVKTE
jgi:uncharacterized protein involved in type VI secretion and phage assembly